MVQCRALLRINRTVEPRSVPSVDARFVVCVDHDREAGHDNLSRSADVIVALLYLQHAPRVTCVIPGPRNVAELEADVGVADRLALSDEQGAEFAHIGSRVQARTVPTESGTEVVGVPLRPEWLVQSN